MCRSSNRPTMTIMMTMQCNNRKHFSPVDVHAQYKVHANNSTNNNNKKCTNHFSWMEPIHRDTDTDARPPAQQSPFVSAKRIPFSFPSLYSLFYSVSFRSGKNAVDSMVWSNAFYLNTIQPQHLLHWPSSSYLLSIVGCFGVYVPCVLVDGGTLQYNNTKN